MTLRPTALHTRGRCLAMMGLCLLALLYNVAAAQQTPFQQPQKRSGSPREQIKEGAERFRERAEREVRDFAVYADRYFRDITQNRAVGWATLLGAALVGVVTLLYGWVLVKSLLIPFAPVWGLATGGATAFCIIQAMYTEREVWFRLLVLAVGVTLGLGLYLFSALRAKPVAAFLVILSPFLILGAFLLPHEGVLGLIIFCTGLLAGFAAMVEVRPLAIISTSLFGAGCIVSAYGLLAHLIGRQLDVVRDSFDWLMAHALMLVLVWLVVAFVGANFQFSTGPRGTLED